jgi:diguanylate cyclase
MNDSTIETDAEQQALMFDVAAAEEAAEHLRQALQLLGKISAAPTPLNYTLFYNYVAGKSERLNREIDGAIAQHGALAHDDAVALFQRFFGAGGESLVDDIRNELVGLVAQVIGSLIDIAGRTSLVNETIAQQIDRLAETDRPSEVVAAASAILAETRQFVTRSRQLETEITTSVEEMNRLKEELTSARREAAIDSLTGIFNRRAFDRRLEELIEQVDGLDDVFCLLLLDIDLFKRINDTYGHIVGDKVLSEFAKQIGRATRRSDFLARYGGEEFAILLPRTRITSAFTVAENIRATLEHVRLRRSQTGEAIDAVTVSVGVASYRSDETGVAFVGRCDKALYRAKQLGRNRVVLAD